MTLQRPEASEHDAYYGRYVDQVPPGDISKILEDGLERTSSLLGSLTPEQEVFRYAEGKWSIREIVGHLIDTEWTFTYRGLCFARSDPAELPPMDQDRWAAVSNAHRQPLSELLETLACTRRSSLAIFRSFGDDEWLRRGIASGCEFTVRSMPYIIAGHEIHHQKVLTERYLG